MLGTCCNELLSDLGGFLVNTNTILIVGRLMRESIISAARPSEGLRNHGAFSNLVLPAFGSP